jgi:hypothetical protein
MYEFLQKPRFYITHLYRGFPGSYLNINIKVKMGYVNVGMGVHLRGFNMRGCNMRRFILTPSGSPTCGT